MLEGGLAGQSLACRLRAESFPATAREQAVCDRLRECVGELVFGLVVNKRFLKAL